MLRRTLLIGSMFLAVPAHAQNTKAPEIKLLSPAECAAIKKQSDNEFYIEGTVVIGGMTITRSNVPRNGISYNDVDPFDVINRSCFRGNPS